MKFSIHQVSHIGNRKYNQDRVAYVYSNDTLMLVLADGMGGHLHGDVAAGLAINTFVESFGRDELTHIADPNEFVRETMRQANERIMKLSHYKALEGFPGSTCVAALILNGKIYWGHAGDSRFYLLRDGAVFVKTCDHSLVQEWCNLGLITAAEALVHPQRSRITNCLGGAENMFYIESGEPITLKPGDVLLLCSDGLWGPFTDQELAEAFVQRDLSDVLDGLVARALERDKGHSDNLTAIAVLWGESEVAHATEVPASHIPDIH